MLAIFGVVGMSAIWGLIALILDRQCAWMAAVAALDIALLLRLGRAAPGLPRAIGTLAATTAVVMTSNWIIAASQVGGPMGFRTLDALQRLGETLDVGEERRHLPLLALQPQQVGFAHEAGDDVGRQQLPDAAAQGRFGAPRAGGLG